ncbi:LysR family transcriptional regulator [Mycobacteroides abscessus]|uniref:LysR family transcriptional regulator n=1 Tax=Mycobacteroides abscessus TaxID=36809 RepID=UPI00092B4043|nr:LysR family transcriptional regulator [Mycobacteroides abscessus]SII55310.1 Putative transcriptional regulator, LysR family [Mycobacteroides abscessus subsp. abscessus]
MPEHSAGIWDDPVDLRRLQQFLSVAEHSGFTRAAQQLRLTQQAISQSVTNLEKQVGAKLFDRSGRHIALTPAGEVLRDGSVVLLAAAQTLVRQVQNTAAEQPRPFVVAHTPAITAEEVHQLLVPVRSALPNVSVTALQVFPNALEPAVIGGSADIALRRGIATPKNLASRVIGYHVLRVAVPREHLLAERDSVALRDLRNERIIVWAPPGVSHYTDFILSTCRSAGFEPVFVINHVQGTPPVTAVLDNDGVAFVTAPTGPCLAGQVVVIDIVDPPQAPIQAIWLPHTQSAIRDALTNG